MIYAGKRSHDILSERFRDRLELVLYFGKHDGGETGKLGSSNIAGKF